MFTHYRTQAFVLKIENRGEADQLITVFSKDFGKLEILAKAIRKINSKLRSGVEIFYLSEIEFIQGKNYKTLTDAILIEKFDNIRRDFKKLKIAYKILEIINNLIKEQEPDRNIWQLLREFFFRLNQLKIKNFEEIILYFYFCWNLFALLGYEPELYCCLLCQKKLIPQKIFFSFKEGGLICQNCSKRLKLTNEISIETIKILRIFLKRNWFFLKKIKIKKENLNSLKKITQAYYRYIFKEFLNK